jgi:rhamnulokinase
MAHQPFPHQPLLMNPQHYLCADIGAESGRLMGGSWDGNKLALSEIHRFPNAAVPLAGSLRWDLLGLWREIRAGLRRASQQFGGQIRSVGVDTWGLDYVLQDGHGEWLGLPHCYRDGRTSGLIEAATAIVPRAEIFAYSGVQFMEINTLYQLLAARRAQPRLLEAARKMLLIPDWIHWALCGAQVCEATNASTTQFLHPSTGMWSAELLNRLSIPTHFLPELVRPGTDLGAVRGELAGECGLAGTRVVAPATHDTGSAVVAVPTRDTGTPSWAYISSGTWSLMGIEVPEAVLNDTVLRHNFTNEGGVDGTYRLLKNIMGLWLVQQLRQSFLKKNGTADYEQLVHLAEQSPALRSLVDPDDIRFLRPPDMAAAIQDACRNSRQPVPETEGQLVRCALESLALRYRQVLDTLEVIAGRRIKVLHIVGGGSRNRLLNQFTADACNRTVVAGPVETTAIGNLLWQTTASGEIASLADARQIVRDSFGSQIQEFHPRLENLAEWDAANARWIGKLP